MATGAGASQYSIVLVVVAVILARVSWRTLKSHRGTRFSLGRTYFYTAVYVVIGVLFSGLSYAEGVPYLLAVPELALAAAAAVGSYRYTDGRISFWRTPDGTLFFRGGVAIYLVYLVALVLRLAIDLAVLGPSAFAVGTAVTLAGATLYATMGADLLLTFGVGLLIGRGVRVARRYGRISAGEEKLQGAPNRMRRAEAP
ncbi:MAG: hypothetical protein JRM73_00815 [Nitrososphaerota archaeon]|nr:hypothetical protein [Nitrososphaerota archaeon]